MFSCFFVVYEVQYFNLQGFYCYVFLFLIVFVNIVEDLLIGDCFVINCCCNLVKDGVVDVINCVDIGNVGGYFFVGFDLVLFV